MGHVEMQVIRGELSPKIFSIILERLTSESVGEKSRHKEIDSIQCNTT